jgi:hypothetical protein
MRIHTLFARFAASVFLLPACQLQAQGTGGHPDVTGVWRMDTTKFAKHDAALTALTLRTLNVEERWTIDPSGHVLTRLQHVVDETVGRVSQQTLVFTRR